jgi:segregation and condensation protein B
VLEQLKELYAQEGRGLQLVEVAGGFQITTRPEFHEVVSRLLSSPKPARLSLQALETLAVIAYRQPITVPELLDLRGVRSASVVRTLLEKKLVESSGGSPWSAVRLMYGTTKEFLLRFGLKDLRDLPSSRTCRKSSGTRWRCSSKRPRTRRTLTGRPGRPKGCRTGEMAATRRRGGRRRRRRFGAVRERLQKILSNAGIARRAAEKLIEEGRVEVDGG